MSILVTGATGFIGSHIARKLVERGEKVKILLRKTSKTSNINGLDVERFYGDILDIDSVRTAIKGCDTLYHVAGLVSSKKAHYKKMEDINVGGTINVLSAALEEGLKKVVYTSSIGAIGVDPNRGIANEETPFTLEHLGIQYINTKHYAEKEAIKFYEKGLPLVIVNPSVVVGPGDIYLASNGFVVLYCKRRYPGYIDGAVNLVSVDDVAEGHILAAEKGRLGERYVLANKNCTIKELFDLLERVTGIKSPRLKIPYLLALAGGYFFESILRLPFTSFVLLDTDSVKATSQYWYFDSSKAVNELGLPQTSIEKTLEEAVVWFRDNRYL
ncbi:SDR family oxidoreductase [Desulfobacterota bacterium AH_259_B03_O07]|nr:SDR family oxidoreductase [Desulfobacterota bacterium AH_259_B03_O07]